MLDENAPFRYNLTRAILKSVPIVGAFADQIVFETIKQKADAQSKQRLQSQLDAIQSSIEGQTTDLGDILNRLEKIDTQHEFLNSAIVAIALYLREQATASTAQIVERAGQSLPELSATAEPAPSPPPAQTPPPPPKTYDRFSLFMALQKQLNPDQLNFVIGDIPDASNSVAQDVSKNRKIDELLRWADSVEGCTLEQVVFYVQRRYKRFDPNPP